MTTIIDPLDLSKLQKTQLRKLMGKIAGSYKILRCYRTRCDTIVVPGGIVRFQGGWLRLVIEASNREKPVRLWWSPRERRWKYA
jgi:hypothetical protein